MRGQWTGSLLIYIAVGLIGACGSAGGSPQVDARAPRQDVTIEPPPPEVDAGCDEDAMGVDYCIINSPGGGGSVVTRQNPVNYAACK